MGIVKSGSLVMLPDLLGCPRRVGKPALHPIGDIEPTQQKVGAPFDRIAQPFLDAVVDIVPAGPALTTGVPQSGKVRLAVGGTRSGSRAIKLPVFCARNAFGMERDPLRI
jgi:hypothetical protein